MYLIYYVISRAFYINGRSYHMQDDYTSKNLADLSGLHTGFKSPPRQILATSTW